MKVESFIYTQDNGWSVKQFPLTSGSQTLVVVFGSATQSEISQPMTELTAHYADSIILGCSTAGEIYNDEIHDHSLSVAVAQFENTRLKLTRACCEKTEYSQNAGREIAQALADDDLTSVLLLSEGMTVNGSDLVAGIHEVLADDIIVTGGLAGDADRFQQTWTIADGKMDTGWVTAVGFYGDAVHVAHGSRGGWDIFGVEREVTKSSGNILYELDGIPALQLYKEYLGDRAKGLPATGLLFPLAVSSQYADKERVVRTILAVDEEAQSLTFAGDIQQGSMAQLMRANFDRLIDGASDAAESLMQMGAIDSPSLTIAISCVGRRLVLGEIAEEELDATLDVLPDNTRQIGFYSYGEISPHVSGLCDLHNQTMTLTTIYER